MLTGAGASSGIGTAGFEISALYILILLGWVFVPVYIRWELIIVKRVKSKIYFKLFLELEWVKTS